MWKLSTMRWFFLAVAIWGALPCRAVIIATGDGTGNTTAPADDPGWANVGTRTTGLTVIYLGNGWVLTANHVGAGDVILAGKTYSAVAGSAYQLVNSDNTLADVLLFKINGNPLLPSLSIADTPPTTTSVVTVMGASLNRGAATTWNGYDGFYWGSGTTLRWGTAPVSQLGVSISLNGDVTQSFSTVFAEGGSNYPAQAAAGDSGGAAFLKVNGTWMLAGVLFAIDSYANQPYGTALYGNHTFATDLSVYRYQILAETTPGCGLGVELAPVLPLLLWLNGRRRRRAA